MKKIALLSLAAVALLALSACSKKKASGGLTIEKGVLKVGMEIGYPPFEYYDTDGSTPTGFDVELGKELAKRLGLEKAEFIDTAWDGILAGLDTNKYDVILSAMTITPERKANYSFSVPYIGNGQCIVLRNDSTLKINTPSDLEGKQVGYQDETTSDIYITKYAQENGLNFVPAEYDKVLNAFDDLKLGRIDAVVADALVAVDYLSKPGNPFVMVWQGTPDEFFGACVKQGNAELQSKITDAINAMFDDGTLAKISDKIFNADMTSSAKGKN